VHTTPEELENGGFTLETHQIFSVHNTTEEFGNATITGHFGFVFEENSVRKLRFQNVFRPHENEKPAFSNFSGLKSVSERLRFRDGLVWVVGLTVEIKLRFQIFPK